MTLRPSHQGFTIIEVIAAIAVVSIGLLTTYSLMGSTINVTTRNKHYAVARERLNQALEETRALPYTSLVSNLTTEQVTELPSGQLIRDIGVYNGDSGLKQMIITVTWREKGHNETLSAATLATPGGLNGH